MKRLKEHQIGTRPFFWCMHEQPVFHKMGLLQNISCPVAERREHLTFVTPKSVFYVKLF
jgi:perosamine synthetase